MASLDVSHDDMIDLLIGHANMPMTPNNQRPHGASPHHHNQLPSHHEAHNNQGTGQNPMTSHSHPVHSYHHHHHPHHHQVSSHYNSHQQHHQNQVGPVNINVQNHVNMHHHSVQNLVNTPLSSQNQVITSSQSQVITSSQNQVITSSQNQVITSSQNQVTTSQEQAATSVQTQVITSAQSQGSSSSPNPVLTTNQFDSPSQIPPSSDSHLSSQETHVTEDSSPNEAATQQSPESLDQLVPQADDDIQPYSNNIADLKPQNFPTNQYLCPGCQKSILYTNRSSLVQLLSLHQEKCPGTTRYRYMCLECHSAFRTVSQLQEHEDICGPENDRPNRSVIESDKQERVNGTGGMGSDETVGVIQSIPGHPPSTGGLEEQEDVKPPVGLEEELGIDGEENGECGTKVSVRESWTQTYDQPKPERKEIVNVLLDEISPAGRKRRMCTRKMKVYNEKEMAHVKECCELDDIKPVRKKSPKALIKKELPVKKSGRGRKPKKKILADENAPAGQQGTSEKPEPEQKQRKTKMKKVKEHDLEVPMHCQLCPKTFTRYSMYTKHYQLNHEKAMCQYCGAQCIRKKLRQHERLHLKVYKCTYPGCEKTVNSKHRLNRHSRVHTGEKPYTCDICHKPFAGKENMVKHKKRVHEKEKKYQCRFCGQKFADRGGLKYHENTHTKQRPTDYRCKYCGRGYKSHVGCYLHERTHTGNMYKCGFCGKEFMAKVHLRKHEYIHTGNYPFRCMGCQKGFPNNGAMKKHKCIAQL